MDKKRGIISFLVIILILLGYWSKNQMNIDFFESFSLSKYVPFKFLQRNEVITLDKTGVLLYDNFNFYNLRSKWLKLYLEDKGDITQSYDSNGFNNSRCLLIKSNCNKNWEYSCNKLVEIKKGCIFNYSTLVKINGTKSNAFVGIDTFNDDKNVIQWYRFQDQVADTNKWILVEKRFTVDENFKYIRFRLSGKGIGEFRFDNISLAKLTVAGH
jgi:hypothetical protein